jgi:hypothetical protein
MFDIVNGFGVGSNQWLNIFLLMAAAFRVYLEIIKFDLATLPITRGMFKEADAARKFHRHGLYMSMGYIVLSAPFMLFS